MPRRPALHALALPALVLACAGSPAILAQPASADDWGRAARRGAQEQPTLGERAVRTALTAVGVPYRYGGQSPTAGFDCSGLVRWAYARVGLDLPHSSYALYAEGRRVARAQLEPGDLLFFEGLGHVGLYLGRGRMVHAPRSGRSVEVVSLASDGYGSRLIGARRVATA
ncbi:MAG TPA: C40 family peptidase [Gaiellaceae bacterium]|nr:C40 family peptidase [Gaiellaceae bacterium]